MTETKHPWAGFHIQEALRDATQTEGILLPGFDCPACGMFTGTAKVDHVTCRCCGAPRPDDAPWGRRFDGTPMPKQEWAVHQNLEHTIEANIVFHERYKAMLATLTSTQERCTELKLENRELRALLLEWWSAGLNDRVYVLAEETRSLLKKLGVIE